MPVFDHREELCGTQVLAPDVAGPLKVPSVCNFPVR